tara:strand:+ start:87455 stop:88234 length:780 start_codon:yes stop_codon:yes gene_type:complete
MKQLLIGAGYIFFGFRYLFHPAARKFVLIPICINIGIFIIAFYWGYEVSTSKLDSLLQPATLPSWLSWLEGFLNWALTGLKWLLGIIWFALFAFLFSIFGSLTANLIASPFNGLLCESIDKNINQYEPKPISTFKLIAHSVLREIHKWFYYLPRLILIGLLCFVLYFIPVANIISTGILYLFGAWMLAFQYLDFAADNRNIKVKELNIRVKERRMLSYGFGIAVFSLTLVPVVNFIILPVATIAATKLWAEHFAEIVKK